MHTHAHKHAHTDWYNAHIKDSVFNQSCWSAAPDSPYLPLKSAKGT